MTFTCAGQISCSSQSARIKRNADSIVYCCGGTVGINDGVMEIWWIHIKD